MHTKEFTARVKAVGKADGLDEDGQFEAIVSVFNNKDSVGDVVRPGAFLDDLTAWKDSGDPLPVIWSHDWANPESHIGVVLEAKETEEGLWVKGQLDLDGMITRTYTLEQINEGYQDMRDGKNIRGVVVHS